MNIPRLVVVLDQSGCQLPIYEVALAALRGGAEQIQLREPDLDSDAYRRLALELVGAGVPSNRLAVNGHPDLAHELGSNLHLPERLQKLMPVPEFAGLVSTSVHAESPALPGGFDYLVAGNVFPTKSHPGRSGLGTDGVRRIVESTHMPILAIGGIEPELITTIMSTGAIGVAVRSYIVGSADPEESTRNIREELDRWRN